MIYLLLYFHYFLIYTYICFLFFIFLISFFSLNYFFYLLLVFSIFILQFFFIFYCFYFFSPFFIHFLLHKSYLIRKLFNILPWLFSLPSHHIQVILFNLYLALANIILSYSYCRFIPFFIKLILYLLHIIFHPLLLPQT